MKLFNPSRGVKDGPVKTAGILHVAVSTCNAWIHAGLDRFNKKAATLSTRQLKGCLAVFCLSFTGISFALVWESLRFKTAVGSQAFLPRVQAPIHIGKVREQQYNAIISPDDFNRVERIKKYLDSMHIADAAGYHLLMDGRPLLGDSIALFEQLYQRQIKK